MVIIVWKAVILLCAIIGGISGLYYLREKKVNGIKAIIVIAIIGVFLVLFLPEAILVIYPDNNKADVGQRTSSNQGDTIDTRTIVGIESNDQPATQTPTQMQNVITEKNVPVKKVRIEATGESGYKLTEKWALEEAEKDAYNKLKRRLNKHSLVYDIDNKKTSVVQTEHDGWKATVVIFTYE